MFYSQFILAKKGPLGTIWIAAHLERKLRKNQVADTDIGVSVDTILCPEVPIALRLSSHLLLGVVRIYSRKVNYLFDDCSEALLKIKQAFRSTAVDLPPEESKAPYHSITLPETFDLDDFELPDNDVFKGNYVDHHTSTREQITLQDNMEGVVFSTSQFGLDERFGDGETSGLNLDEEFFLPKADNASGVSGDHPSSAHAATPMQNEGYGGLPAYPESRIENLNVEGDLMDYAQAPSTPGLMETPNLANVQEISACEDHMDDDDNPLVEFALNGNSETISSKLSQHQENAQLVDWSLSDDKNSVAAVDIPCGENGNHFIDLDIEKWHPPKETPAQNISPDDPASASGTCVVADAAQGSGEASNLTEMPVSVSSFLDKKLQLEDVILEGDGVNDPSISNEDRRECNGIITKGSAQDASCSISCLQMSSGVSDYNQTAPFGEMTKDMELSGSPGRLTSCNGAAEIIFEQHGLSSLEQPVDTHMSNVNICDEVTCPQVHILRPCSAGLELPDSSHPGGEVSKNLNMAPDVGVIPLESSGDGEMTHASGPVIVLQDGNFLNLKENYTAEPRLVEDSHAGSGKSDNQVNNVVGGGSTVENVSSSISAVIPAPEKLLSLPEGHNNQLRGPLLEATPGDLACVDESVAGSRIISGKKRSYTESTPAEHSLYSVGSTRVVRAERTAEAIPDDNDLLSSILVGRSSYFLKVKSTPLPHEINSLKRRRHAPRTSAFKRKALMDDTMVLHGDTIRQQLTNTEDIRRLRKKAPCTVPEISSIQKQFLEDELFVEPLCSGVSLALVSLFNQEYDLSRIKVYKDDANGTPVLSASDMKVISSNEGIANVTDSGPAGARDCGEFAAVKEISDLQLDETIVLSRNELDEGHEVCVEPSITDLEINHTDNKEDAEPASSLPCLPQNLVDSEVGGTNVPSEAVGVAQSISQDKGVNADALLEMQTAAVSFVDKRESENIMEPSITYLEINHIENEEDAEPASSLPCLPQTLADNEIGGTNGPSEAAGVAQLTSPDKEVDADALLEMEAADVSFTDKRESENVMEAAAVSCDDKREADDVMMDDSLVNGERNADEERFDTVKLVDTLATSEVEPNESDAVLLEGAQCDGAVEFDRYYGGQVQYDACGMSVEIEADTSRGDYNEPLCGASNGPQILTSSHHSEFRDLQGSFVDNGEYQIQHEGYPSNMVGAEISGLDMQDYNDFNYSAAANDTEFLNVDDDEVAEFSDDYVPNAEETRLLDNSGWSSRTRAVGNYLQTLFMKEAEHDRKVLHLDNILVGKTRKEACRMFFETLVLKTKDYIQVEQECPFQNINIKPKMKLLKSDF